MEYVIIKSGDSKITLNRKVYERNIDHYDKYKYSIDNSEEAKIELLSKGLVSSDDLEKLAKDGLIDLLSPDEGLVDESKGVNNDSGDGVIDLESGIPQDDVVVKDQGSEPVKAARKSSNRSKK